MEVFHNACDIRQEELQKSPAKRPRKHVQPIPLLRTDELIRAYKRHGGIMENNDNMTAISIAEYRERQGDSKPLPSSYMIKDVRKLTGASDEKIRNLLRTHNLPHNITGQRNIVRFGTETFRTLTELILNDKKRKKKSV